LIHAGLDSIRLMTLVERWQKAGRKLSFVQLGAKPTLLDWWGSNAPPENWLAALLEWLPPKQPYDDIEPYPRDAIEALITRLS
jgi:hypothetical protein